MMSDQKVKEKEDVSLERERIEEKVKLIKELD
jgi:hypothetical protein